MSKFIISESEKIQILSMYMIEQTNISQFTSGYTQSTQGSTDISKLTSGYGQKTKGTDIASLTSGYNQKTKGTDISSLTSGYKQPVSGTTDVSKITGYKQGEKTPEEKKVIELSSRDSQMLSSIFTKITDGVKNNKLETIYDGIYKTYPQVFNRPQLKELYQKLNDLYKSERATNRADVKYKKNWINILRTDLGYIRRVDKTSLTTDINNISKTL
jgi:hypothetical protein